MDIEERAEKWAREYAEENGLTTIGGGGIEGVLTVADMREIALCQGGHCAFCEGPFGDEVPEIDHWVPLAKGGTNWPDNIRLLHRKCNLTKSSKLPEELGLVPSAATEKGN